MHFVGRVFLPLLAAAVVLGAFSTPTVAGMAPPPVNASPAAQKMIGITATGPQADLDRLQAFTAMSGFPSKQMDAPEGWELFVVFPPGSDAAAVAAFIDRLRSEFSTLEFGYAMAPVSP